MPVLQFAESFDLEAAFGDVREYWSPKVVAQVNDQYVKVAKVRGQLAWHDHANEDELFFVVRGNLTIEYEGAAPCVCPQAPCTSCRAARCITRLPTKSAGSC